MSDSQPTPSEMVQRMIDASHEVETAVDLPTPGFFAQQFADAYRGVVTAENIEAFIHGAAVMNLLTQECILRVACIGGEQRDAALNDPEGDADSVYYAQGCHDGALYVTTLLGMHADDFVQGMIEDPSFDREFNGIVENYS